MAVGAGSERQFVYVCHTVHFKNIPSGSRLVEVHRLPWLFECHLNRLNCFWCRVDVELDEFGGATAIMRGGSTFGEPAPS